MSQFPAIGTGCTPTNSLVWMCRLTAHLESCRFWKAYYSQDKVAWEERWRLTSRNKMAQKSKDGKLSWSLLWWDGGAGGADQCTWPGLGVFKLQAEIKRGDTWLSYQPARQKGMGYDVMWKLLDIKCEKLSQRLIIINKHFYLNC